MSSELPRTFVIAAFVLVLLGATVLGMSLQSYLKPTAPSSAPVAAKYAFVTLSIQGNSVLGPDNKTHDAFVPADFTVYSGQTVNLTIMNFDTMPHSFTSTTLNVDFQAPATSTPSVANVSQFQFTAPQPGAYRWYCNLPCDGSSGGWAMTTGSDGQPGQLGYMGGYVTVLQG